MSTSRIHCDQKCDALLQQSKAVQMGILNITPDSFSDGGSYLSQDVACQQALHLVGAGAWIIDVGGVSTRPGAMPVTADTEWQRVAKVLEVLRLRLPANILISLDTASPEVAFRAARASLIDIINDVAAARITHPLPENAHNDKTQSSQPHWTTAHVAAHFRLGLVLMHMQGEPRTMQLNPRYDDCISEVVLFLKERLEFARSLGVRWCAIDPGIGFGKTLEHNISLLSPDALTQLTSLAAPVLIGLSRKSFLKHHSDLHQTTPHFQSPREEIDWRDKQSEIWERACVNSGARIIRTHIIKTSF